MSKDGFMYWEENVATDEELELSFDEKMELYVDWDSGYCDYVYGSMRDDYMMDKVAIDVAEE
jgi:hypothetical protein